MEITKKKLCDLVVEAAQAGVEFPPYIIDADNENLIALLYRLGDAMDKFFAASGAVA